jgi:predicted phosphodiesterase
MEAQGQGGADDRGRKDIGSRARVMGKINLRHKYIGTLLLILLTLGSACAAQVQQINQKLAELEKVPPQFNFAVLGDNRSGDDIYRKIISMAMKRNPDFIVNVGDMITMPGNLTEWSKFWEMSRPITVPYFLTVGNHDVSSRVPESEKIYKEQVNLPGNELYYSFTAGNSLFIVLDTSLADQEESITGDQYLWLEGVLANSAQKHKFVFLHHPPYPMLKTGQHEENGNDENSIDRDRLEALFMKNKVDVVFAGHEHFYHRQMVDGVIHVISGGGGAPLYAKDEDGGFFHYIFVAVDGDTVSGEVVDINGKVRDRF